MTRTTGRGSLVGLGDVAVLVVEDEYFIAQDIAGALTTAGAQVVGPVANVRTAIEMLASEPVQAAVLDLNLHGVVDFSIAAELDRRGIPFVFATGYEPATVPRTYEHVPLWRKPFFAEELISYLERSNFGRTDEHHVQPI